MLAAYGNSCALTGYSLNYEGAYIGIEAAHICWPQVGGNEAVTNGIAMSTLHRKLFHLGLFTINSTYEVQVSNQLQENIKATLSLGKLHGKHIALPDEPKYYPSVKNLKWHSRWVFRG